MGEIAGACAHDTPLLWWLLPVLLLLLPPYDFVVLSNGD